MQIPHNERGIQPGPLATFPKWKELGRHVKKGTKAITLCMPLTCTRAKTVKKDDGTNQEEEFSFTHFTYKANWYVLAQTEGAEYQPGAIPEWNEQTALSALKVERIPFEDLHGNAQGCAKRGRRIALSPIAVQPCKTLFHELAHGENPARLNNAWCVRTLTSTLCFPKPSAQFSRPPSANRVARGRCGIARHLNFPPQSLQQELDSLVRGGTLLPSRKGNPVHFQAAARQVKHYKYAVARGADGKRILCRTWRVQ